MLAPSLTFIYSSSLSTPAVYQALNICHYFHEFFFRSIAQLKIIWNRKTRGFGSLIRRDFAKFEKKFLKVLEIERVSQVRVSFSSITVKLEITVLFDIPRDLRDSHNFYKFFFETFSLKNACFLTQSVLRHYILIFYIILFQYGVSIS